MATLGIGVDIVALSRIEEALSRREGFLDRIYTPAERAVLAWVDALVLQGGRASDETFEALREHLSELAVLELTYIACWYDLHAVMSKALRLELDDVDDRITELTGPGITSSLRPPQSE